MIVYLLHGCRLEVLRNLVQMGCQCACGLKKRHQNQITVPPGEEKNLKVLLSIALNHSPLLQQILNCKLYKAPYSEQADFYKTGWPGSWIRVFLTCHHIKDTNCWCCSFVFVFIFWQSCTEESIPPLSGVPCESVTFSVPSISSCRFLCHLCTTCFPRILSCRPSNTIKVLPTTQQSSKRNGHRMSHILWGLKDILYSPREDPLLTDVELIFNWPSLNIALIKRWGKVWASPTCLQTAIWEPGTENSQDFYWYTVLYLNVFVMCIILYYRFAVLAQFFKLLFISFITWKK